ncbi:MAG: hypothetical protein NTV30_00520 [Chloroflexi bacterium]|nr:hypothetical protein [Chloroflexota bacterium]
MLRKLLIAYIGVITILLYSLPATVFALTDTTIIKGTIGSVISVDAPAEILVAANTGLLTEGSNPSGQQTITVQAYGNWTMTARDVTTSGYMKKNGTSLTNKLQISQTGASGEWYNADVDLSYSGTGNQTKSIYANQDIVSGDAPGNYTITITFNLTQSS